MTRADEDYPARLKSRLKTNSPPVLFGCGDRSLLNLGGLAVVGSRNADQSDLEFTQEVGEKAAGNNIAIVSGCARGVDEASMIGAMRAGGAVVGVVADSLIRKITSSKWRKGLMDGNVVLVSPYHPDAGFNAGNAMSRNKYIYCLAESSLVIHSGTSGGTLNGAEENLRNNWVPLWVKPTADKASANGLLVSKGGHWTEEAISAFAIKRLFAETAEAQNNNLGYQSSMFDTVEVDKDKPIFAKASELNTEATAPNVSEAEARRQTHKTTLQIQ